ncbi:MAG: CPBP family intramembrane glutamic endopeptidase [Longimicrobiales bacterium]|nr:CPBP family intramembrane glutamic endopeptidase [Longimicrobiales bacterium]
MTPDSDVGREVEPQIVGPPEEPGLSPQARRLGRRLFWIATGLFLIVTTLLHVVGGLPVVDAILLGVLLAAAPGLAIAQVPLVEGVVIERLPAYWSSIFTLSVVGMTCWLVGGRAGGAEALGLVPLSPEAMVVWSLGLTAAGLLVIAVFHVTCRWTDLTDSALLEALLPRTARERRAFALLSVSAGVGEEMAYRGYAIPALSPLLGLTGAAVVSTAVFGVVHAYQGPLGIVRTGLMGGILAWGFLASGSLWPSMIAHTLIDLIAGIALGDRLLVTSTSDPS